MREGKEKGEREGDPHVWGWSHEGREFEALFSSVNKILLWAFLLYLATEIVRFWLCIDFVIRFGYLAEVGFWD